MKNFIATIGMLAVLGMGMWTMTTLPAKAGSICCLNDCADTHGACERWCVATYGLTPENAVCQIECYQDFRVCRRSCPID